MLNRFISGLPIIALNVVVFRVINAGLNVLGLSPERWIVDRLVEAPSDAWVDLVRWSGILALALISWAIMSLFGSRKGFALQFDRNTAIPLMHSSPFVQVLTYTGGDNKLIQLSRKDFFVLVENLSNKDTVKTVKITLEYIVIGIPIPVFRDLPTEDLEMSADINPQRRKRFFLISKYHPGFLPTGNLIEATSEEISLAGKDMVFPYRIAQKRGPERINLPNQKGAKFYLVVSGENWPSLYCGFEIVPTDGDACEIKPLFMTSHKVLYQPRLSYRIREIKKRFNLFIEGLRKKYVSRKTPKS